MSNVTSEHMSRASVNDESLTVSPAIRYIHWISAIAVTLAYLVVLAREWVDLPGADKALLSVHRSFGACVLALTLLRSVTRMTGRTSDIEMAAILRFAGHAVHSALYVLLVAVPVLGWLLTNARGMPVTVFGMVDLPVLVPRDRDFAEILETWHEAAAWTLLSLIGLHIAAALWHALIRRDELLNAMLGRRSK